MVFPVCYSDKHFVNSSPTFYWAQKEKSVQNFRAFRVILCAILGEPNFAFQQQSCRLAFTSAQSDQQLILTRNYNSQSCSMQNFIISPLPVEDWFQGVQVCSIPSVCLPVQSSITLSNPGSISYKGRLYSL